MASDATVMPQWLVFYQALRGGIISGRINSSHQLALLELKQQLNLELTPAQEQEVINFLIAEGLIKRHQNQIMVTPLPARSRRDTGFIEDYRRANRQPTIQTLRLEVLPIQQIPEAAQHYIVNGTDELWIRHYHVQLIDGLPYALADSYIPHRLFNSLVPVLRHSSTDLFRLMGDVGYPPTIKEERLYIDMPTLAEREALQMLDLMRVQVMRLECQVWSDATLVEVCLLCDRADLYEFNYRVELHV